MFISLQFHSLKLIQRDHALTLARASSKCPMLKYQSLENVCACLTHTICKFKHQLYLR